MAGVPPAQRTFDVTVANILQVVGVGGTVVGWVNHPAGCRSVCACYDMAQHPRTAPCPPHTHASRPHRPQGPLVGLAPRLAAYTKPGGLLGLSGASRRPRARAKRSSWPGPARLPGCWRQPASERGPAQPPLRRPQASWRSRGPRCTPRPEPSPSPLPCRPPAGILAEQAPAVVEAYSPWFQGFRVEGEERWALVTAVRKQQ